MFATLVGFITKPTIISQKLIYPIKGKLFYGVRNALYLCLFYVIEYILIWYTDVNKCTYVLTETTARSHLYLFRVQMYVFLKGIMCENPILNMYKCENV